MNYAGHVSCRATVGARIRPPWSHSLGLYRARQLAQIAINLWADLCRRSALASKIYRSAMTAAPKLAHGHRHLSLECPLSFGQCPLSFVRSCVGSGLAFVSGIQFLVFCCSGVLMSWRSCVLVWMARGRHPFSGSFLHEWPSSRQTGGSVETCGQDMGCVRMCADLIILAARLDAFLCDFCRKLISSRHVCTHHQHSLPIVCAVWTWVWVSVQTVFAPYLRLILYE